MRARILYFAMSLLCISTMPVDLTSIKRENRYDIQDLKVLRGSVYLNELRNALSEAKKRILVCMFIIAAEENSEHPVTKLIEILKKANDDGVDVMVVIDERFRDKNTNAYKSLRRSGVDIRYDRSARIMHSKLVIADDVLFVGSANWSATALTGGNLESTIKLEDRNLADRLYNTRIQFFDRNEREAMEKAATALINESRKAFASDAGGKVRRELLAAGINPEELIAAGTGWCPPFDAEFRKRVLNSIGAIRGWSRWGLPEELDDRLILQGANNSITVINWKEWKIESGVIKSDMPVLKELEKRIR